MSIRTGDHTSTGFGSTCSVCGGQVIVERGGLWTHLTCLNCGDVQSRVERAQSFSQAILLFMARGQ